MWWWLSFADPSVPKGTQFRGVAIVEGKDLQEAAGNATLRGLNPGGEVAGWPVPAEEERRIEGRTNRLLSVAELQKWSVAAPPGPKRDELIGRAQKICACCNGAIHKRAFN